MKIRTLDKLQDLLYQDLMWRKKELIDIKMLINSTSNPMLSRVGIALLSAHFEGFIKQGANYYIVFVASQKLKLEQLTNNFSSLFFEKKFEMISTSKKVSVNQGFIDQFLEEYYDKNFKVNYTKEKPIIKTEGNPSSNKIKEILLSIGLDYAPYEMKSNYIDADLLKNRHSVVHGEKVIIEKDDFNITFEKIIQIMEIFNDQILNAAVFKLYLKHDCGIESKESVND